MSTRPSMVPTTLLGRYGYRALTPTFIHREILQCRDRGLAYLAVHNHYGNDQRVEFSRVDLESHERGYPALLDIGRGVPVGALVYGRRSVAADIWLPDGSRRSLGSYRVISNDITRLYSQPCREHETKRPNMTAKSACSAQLANTSCKRARWLSLGSAASDRWWRNTSPDLAWGTSFLLIRTRIEGSNLSRVVGATQVDVEMGQLKTQIAVRHAREMATQATLQPVAGDVSRHSVAQVLRDCDFIFLAADSMRARLVVNAIAHQYLVPVRYKWAQKYARAIVATSKTPCARCDTSGRVHWLSLVQWPDRSHSACD